MISSVHILIENPHGDQLCAACITIAFLSKLLQNERYVNAIDDINNYKMLGMLNPLFHCSVILYSRLYCFPYRVEVFNSS